MERLEQETFPEPSLGQEDWLKRTAAALAAIRQRVEAVGPVTLVLAPHLVLTKIIRLPRFERAKREKLIRFSAADSIPWALADVVWGHVAAAEHDLEVLLAAIKLELAEKLCAEVKMAGFELRCALPSTLATLAASRLAPEGKDPVLTVNVGQRSAVLVLATGTRFVVRTISSGGCAQDDGEAIAGRLAQEITRTILFFRREGGWEGPAKIQLTGGGAHRAGLPELLGAKLQLPVECVDAAKIVQVDEPMEARVTNGGQLADLVGAGATQLLGRHPVINLLPPALCRSRKPRILQVAGGVLMAVLGGALVQQLSPDMPVAPVPVAAASIHLDGAETATAPDTVELKETPAVGVEMISPAEEVGPVVVPLRIAGYYGEPSDYRVIFTSDRSAETVVVRTGHRLETLGLTLLNFAVRKTLVPHTDAWPVYDIVGFATLREEKTGREVMLVSRGMPADDGSPPPRVNDLANIR